MQRWIWLAAGGVIGTSGRFLLSAAVGRWLGSGFPFGTLAVNTLGCLLAGFIATLSEGKLLLKPEARMFWMIGLLGAFTTFSALIVESWNLIQQREMALAAVNLLGSVVLGLAAFWLGHWAASSL